MRDPQLAAGGNRARVESCTSRSETARTRPIRPPTSANSPGFKRRPNKLGIPAAALASSGVTARPIAIKMVREPACASEPVSLPVIIGAPKEERGEHDREAHQDPGRLGQIGGQQGDQRTSPRATEAKKSPTDRTRKRHLASIFRQREAPPASARRFPGGWPARRAARASARRGARRAAAGELELRERKEQPEIAELTRRPRHHPLRGVDRDQQSAAQAWGAPRRCLPRHSARAAPDGAA